MLGAGGVGGYFGGMLARAGHEVTLLARGAHLTAIRSRGLELRLPAMTAAADGRAATDAQIFLVPIDATDDAERLPVVDLVLVAVKSYSLLADCMMAIRLRLP